ncbi:MAG TPA: hypothetical protein VED87_04650, partial [Methylocystis sp.]|nr:hypothetical protein [Methylocystis sp.]
EAAMTPLGPLPFFIRFLKGAKWLRQHLAFCVEPLLAEPWIVDADTTIKPLYGHQEGAVLGYNPEKPERPSRCYTWAKELSVNS